MIAPCLLGRSSKPGDSQKTNLLNLYHQHPVFPLPFSNRSNQEKLILPP